MENRELMFMGVDLVEDLFEIIEKGESFSKMNFTDEQKEVYKKTKNFIFDNLKSLLKHYSDYDTNFIVLINNDNKNIGELFYKDLFDIAVSRGDKIYTTSNTTNNILEHIIDIIEEDNAEENNECLTNEKNKINRIYEYCEEKINSDIISL